MGFVYTDLQKQASRKLLMTKVVYRSMYQSEGQLGYTSTGKSSYEINIADDTGNEDVKAVVLLHELGHIYYRHNDIDLRKEFKLIESLLYTMGYTPMDIEFYGGFMHFINIAMDFEVNTRLLTSGNAKIMHDFGFDICLPSKMDIPFKSNFREYYRPLIEKISPEWLKQSRAIQKAMQSMQDLAKNVSGFDSTLTQGKDGLTEESMSVVAGEEYNEGDNKAKKDNVVKKSELQQEMQSFSTTGHSTRKFTLADIAPEEKLVNFFKSLIRPVHRLQEDPIRLYNRRTRANVPNVLYTCHRPRKDVDKRKLAIVIDVSGSMPLEAVGKAIRTLQASFKAMNKDSKVYLWDTSLVESYNITALPEELATGGGTDIASALDYLKDDSFSDIVIYSDFETNIRKLNESRLGIQADIHAIYTTNGYSNDSDLEDFLDSCKTVLKIDIDQLK